MNGARRYPVVVLGDSQCRIDRVQGSSDLRLGRIDRDELSIEVNGSGDIEASGTVGNLIATINGAGDAHLFDLEAKTATVTVQGAGDAELNVSDRLDARSSLSECRSALFCNRATPALLRRHRTRGCRGGGGRCNRMNDRRRNRRTRR